MTSARTRLVVTGTRRSLRRTWIPWPAKASCFNTAWACPWCQPSRTLLMSGQYGFKSRGNLPGTIEPLSHAMQKAGYATFMGGKWHLKGLPGDKEWGFDEHCLYGSLCDAAKNNKEWVAALQGPLVGPELRWHSSWVPLVPLASHDHPQWGICGNGPQRFRPRHPQPRCP